jgi:hypothetical protein
LAPHWPEDGPNYSTAHWSNFQLAEATRQTGKVTYTHRKKNNLILLFFSKVFPPLLLFFSSFFKNKINLGSDFLDRKLIQNFHSTFKADSYKNENQNSFNFET